MVCHTRHVKILGIESSCDDTSVALVENTGAGFTILAEKTASQIEIHKKYGGVVPELAGRQHAEHILPVIEAVLDGQRPDVIAVTAGPGLITGLLVGVEAAKTLSYLWDIPIVAVNHIAGHIHSAEIPDLATGGQALKIKFPALALAVSGGHTELILMKDRGIYERVGATRDDAAGECFDKVAKLLGLDYPGGPKISELAKSGNAEAIEFPRPMLTAPNLHFSFAGLKTAALYYLRDHKLAAMTINPIRLPAGIFGVIPESPTINDFCASFEQAIIDVLVTKTLHAAKRYEPKSILLVGGVSANQKLRHTLGAAIREEFKLINYHLSPLAYAMDNGAMIAAAGYYQALKINFTNWRDLIANPNWQLATPISE